MGKENLQKQFTPGEYLVTERIGPNRKRTRQIGIMTQDEFDRISKDPFTISLEKMKSRGLGNIFFHKTSEKYD